MVIVSSSSGYGHTADYLHIDQSLKSRWQPFCELSQEIERFVPRPISDYAEERAAELTRLRGLNPQHSEESLVAFVDRQISGRAAPWWQMHARFDAQFMIEYVSVCLFAHALCEAVINTVLALGLSHAGSQDLFPLLEKADIKQKWESGPKSFTPAWRFPKGTGIGESLNRLTKLRNELIHYKATVSQGGSPVLKGSNFQRGTYKNESRWLRRFFSLPYDLADHACRLLLDQRAVVILDRHPIERANEHPVIVKTPL